MKPAGFSNFDRKNNENEFVSLIVPNGICVCARVRARVCVCVCVCVKLSPRTGALTILATLQRTKEKKNDFRRPPPGTRKGQRPEASQNELFRNLLDSHPHCL